MKNCPNKKKKFSKNITAASIILQQKSDLQISIDSLAVAKAEIEKLKQEKHEVGIKSEKEIITLKVTK